MRIKVAMLALIAAMTVLPTLNSPAEAKKHRVNYFNRIYNSTYANPYGRYGAYPYGYYSDYQAKQAAANGLINQVNAAISAGQITVQQGNAILIQGHF